MSTRPLNIAVVGLGFMGATHIKAWQQIPDARLGAVVSTDPRKLAGDLSSVGGNLGGAAGQFDFSEIRACHSLEEVLADPAIDVVDICLPTDRHSSAATLALRAGKHVLLEKPLALNAAAADALLKEAARSGRILMVAHVLRFFPAYRKLAQLVRNGASARSALFRRKCGAPAWSPWLIDPARSGGGIMDLLIHDADYCISLWGKPESVHARGYRDLSRGIDIIHAELTWPRLGPVIISGGWHQPGSQDNSYPFSMEFSVVSDASTLEWSSVTENFRQYSSGSEKLSGHTQSLSLEEDDAFVAQLSYFAGCVKAGIQPELCPPAQSAMAVALIEKMEESRENNGRVIQF